jgi:hypothetical protein
VQSYAAVRDDDNDEDDDARAILVQRYQQIQVGQLAAIARSDVFTELYDRALGTFASKRALLQILQLWQADEKHMKISKAWVMFRCYDDADEAGVGAGCCDCFLDWLNRNYAVQYKHVELAFLAESLAPSVDSQFFSFTVDLHSPHTPGSGYVRHAHRERGRSGTFNSDRWRGFHLNRFSELEVLALYVYCARQVGKPINTTGLYWNFLPGLRNFAGTSLPEEQSYFCSQLVASALCWAQPHEFGFLDPRRTTPLSLYGALATKVAVEESGQWRSVNVLEL